MTAPADGAVWRDATVDDGGGLPHQRPAPKPAAKPPASQRAPSGPYGLQRTAKDMTGVRSGHLVVTGYAGRSSKGSALWHCRCDCGAERVVPGAKLRGGDAQVMCRACFHAQVRAAAASRPKKPRVSRARTEARATTLSIRRYRKRDLELDRAAYPDDGHPIPATRGECLPGGSNAERPCPYARCKHHLALDVNERNGNIKLNFPGREVWELAETCALDVADRGGATLEEVGAAVNLTRERLRQIEDSTLARLKEWALLAGMAAHLDESPTGPHLYQRVGIHVPVARLSERSLIARAGR